MCFLLPSAISGSCWAWHSTLQFERQVRELPWRIELNSLISDHDLKSFFLSWKRGCDSWAAIKHVSWSWNYEFQAVKWMTIPCHCLFIECTVVFLFSHASSADFLQDGALRSDRQSTCSHWQWVRGHQSRLCWRPGTLFLSWTRGYFLYCRGIKTQDHFSLCFWQFCQEACRIFELNELNGRNLRKMIIFGKKMSIFWARKEKIHGGASLLELGLKG